MRPKGLPQSLTATAVAAMLLLPGGGSPYGGIAVAGTQARGREEGKQKPEPKPEKKPEPAREREEEKQQPPQPQRDNEDYSSPGGYPSHNRQRYGHGRNATGQHEPRIVFASRRDRGDSEIYSMSEDGGNVRRLTRRRGADIQPAFRPDGRRIAFVAGNGASENIYVMNADGSNPQRLTASRSDRFPAWSPDGQRIVFASERGGDGNTDLYLIDANGGGPATRLTSSPARDTQPAFSPDGRTLAFVSDRENGRNALYLTDLRGTFLRRLTPLDTDRSASSPRFSPDGRSLVFSFRSAGKSDLFLVNADGTHLRAITSGEGDKDTPVFSPDGRRIAFTLRRDDVPAAIHTLNLSGQRPRHVTTRVTDRRADSEHPDWR